MTGFCAAPVVASANIVTIVPTECNGNGGCQSICDLAQLAQNVLNDGIYIAVFLSTILFAWAGWKHMSAGGNSHQIQEANKVFRNVFIGLIIILSAWLIVDTIIGAIGGAPSGHMPWNQICQS
ncbi:MAG TPA: hypothetical protein VMU25_01775 [Candidatus Paceibacterota bacterium]|nr:hypothetical protein [Candidatus Paceibacterota bacterium]